MCHSCFCCEAAAQSPLPGALLQTNRTRCLAALPRALATVDVGRQRLFAHGALHMSSEHLMFEQVLGRGRLSSHLDFGSLSSCLLHKPDLLKLESLLAMTDYDARVCFFSSSSLSLSSPPLPSQQA